MKSVRRKSYWDRKAEKKNKPSLADRLKKKIKSLGRKNIYGTDTTTGKKVKLNF